MAGAESQELRIALAMSGGVSLAIWMGGVTNEVNRLLRGDSAWSDVLEVMDQEPVVDLVSGTSAGGLNGALLAAAMAGGRDLDRLRALWLKDGDFDKLLRPTRESDPPSLMSGDEYFLPELRDAFYELLPERGNAVSAGMSNFKLFTTMTLVNGRARRYVDALGAPIDELDHRGTMHFDAEDLFPAEDGPDRRGIASRLALAARSSASYPVAFEPSWIPIVAAGGSNGTDVDDAHPDMADYSWWQESGFVMDGGLVLNRPIRPLLLAIPDQPAAEGSVRRMVLYVSPNPSGTIPTKPATREMPSLVDVGAAIAGSRFAQSIADDYESLRQHNDEVERRAEMHAGLLGLDDERLRTTADVFAQMWCDRRGADFAARVMTRLAELDVRQAVVPLSGPSALAVALAEQHSRALRAALRLDAGGLGEMNPRDVLILDQAPIDRALRRAQWLARNAMGCNRAEETESLRSLRSRLGLLASTLQRIDEGRFNAWAEAISEAPGAPDALSADDLELTQPRPSDDLRFELYAVAAGVAALHANVARLVDMGGAGADSGPDTSAVAAGVEARVRREATSVIRHGAQPGEVDMTGSVARLVLVDMASAAVTDTGIGDEILELVQVSADAENVFDGRSTPAQKLTGVQLHHFGAFYKSSWRANDWMWGRLDGAMQLVRSVLDSDRLWYRRGYGDGGEPGANVAWVMRRLATAATGASFADGDVGRDTPPPIAPPAPPGDSDVAYLVQDLADQWREAWDEVAAVLDADTDARPPLAKTARWIARRLQLEVLRDELPVVATHAVSDHDRRDDKPEGLDAFLAVAAPFIQTVGADGIPAPAKTPSAKKCVEMFTACRVGQEQIGQQITTTRFVGTASHAFATSVNALSGKSAPGLVRPVAAGLRGTARATTAIARLVTSTSIVAFGALTAVVVGAAAVVALALVRHAQPWPLVAVVAIAVLVAAFAVALCRTPLVIGSAITAAVTLALWGGVGIAVGSWAGDLLHVAVALVGATLLVGVLANAGRVLFAPSGSVSKRGQIAIVVVLVVAGFGAWEAMRSLEFHAGHEAGPCALAPRTTTTTSSTAPSSAASKAATSAQHQSVVCVAVKDDAAATAAAASGALLLLLLLVWFAARQYRRRKQRQAEIAARSAERSGAESEVGSAAV